MKEINQSDEVVALSKTQEEVVIPAPHEFKYLGSKKWVRGLTLYEFNTKTMVFRKTLIDRAAVLENGKPRSKISVIFDKDCIYHQAHNERAAKRKFNNLFKLMGLNYSV